jgi:DNA-binding NarL/FixJ family response regulator
MATKVAPITGIKLPVTVARPAAAKAAAVVETPVVAPEVEVPAEQPRRVNRRWTDEEEEKLMQLVAAGNDHAAIGAELNRTEKAIGLRIKTIAARMLNSGTPLDEVAEATGLKAEDLTPEKLAFVARKIPGQAAGGKKAPNRRWTDEEQTQMLQLLGEGQTRAEVGATLNRTESAIFAKLKKVALALFGQGETMETIWASTGLSEKEVTEEGLKKTQTRLQNPRPKKGKKAAVATQAPTTGLDIPALLARLAACEARLAALEARK